MDVTDTLYVADRAAWRRWLADNYRSAEEIWLIYYRKHTGQPRIPYNDAVEEALCFGWIDSINKGLDDDRLVQRFTPRRPGSSYSQTNKERLKRLLAQGRVAPEYVEEARAVAEEPFEFPADILAALQDSEVAWKNFQRYSGPYRRIRVAYVDAARNRPAEFKKRLDHLVRMTEQEKQFGFGIEAYY